MFDIGKKDIAEGTTDEEPITLSFAPCEEWEALLGMVYPTYGCVMLDRLHKLALTVFDNLRHDSPSSSPDTMTGKDWMLCMRACERWDAPALRKVALNFLSNSVPAVRLATGIEFGIKNFIAGAATILCHPDANLDFVNLLPSAVVVQLMKTREDLSRHAVRGTVVYTLDNTLISRFVEFVQKLIS
jgi:hypothetical protein